MDMDQARAASVRLSQLGLYVDNHIHDKYLAPALTVVTAALLTTWVAPWKALLWAAVELVVIVVYINVYTCFRRAAPRPEDEELWARRIALAHGAHMMSWSSIIVWGWTPDNPSSLMFTMLIHVGLISLTMVMSNPHKRLLFSDLVPPTVALLAPPLLGDGLFNLGLTMLGLLFIALMLLVGLKIHASTTEALDLRERNAELIRELERQVTRDPLTGLANRRHFMATAQAELQRAARYRHPLALLMVDIDHFKPINDTHGHLVGDEVLKAVADTCAHTVRSQDCLARLGGEEFAVLMPETGLEQACAAAERLREAVAGLCCEFPSGVLVPTVSIGVGMYAGNTDTLSSLMRRADHAMYAAKGQGRNRVAVDPSAQAETLPETTGDACLAT
jgi:diguanylate cyclase (GGDEF)-like protein